MSEKIVAFESATARLEKLRERSHKIVQCHGTFDLVHPGHIIHLTEARSLGDALVVTLTADGHVSKGPGRPCFNESLRALQLAALEVVDLVIITPYPAAVEAISLVKPAIYCKGREYEDDKNDLSGKIAEDRAEVARHGGSVRYVGDVVFSSGALLNRHFGHLPAGVKECCLSVASTWSIPEMVSAVDSFANLKVAVVGEAIVDRYTTVGVQGLTSKNRIISAKHIGDESHAGGALAVARHVAQFTPHVRCLSVVGEESWVEPLLGQQLGGSVAEPIVRARDATTIVKQRFVEPTRNGNEISKLFSVNYLEPQIPSSARESFRGRLIELCEWADVLLLLDFGHGLLEEEERGIAQKAGILCLNCQTNSNNFGFNVIDRRYQRADMFTLDWAEMQLATGQKNPDPVASLENLRRKLGAQNAWLTRGSIMTYGTHANQEGCSSHEVEMPPFAVEISDSVGAGDAFFSVASLCHAIGLPLRPATFLSQVAGALAVRIIGNRDPIAKGKLLKAAESLLKK